MKKTTKNYINKLTTYAQEHMENAKNFYENNRFFDTAREIWKSEICFNKIKQLKKEERIKEYNYMQIFAYINELQKEGKELTF